MGSSILINRETVIDPSPRPPGAPDTTDTLLSNAHRIVPTARKEACNGCGASRLPPDRTRERKQPHPRLSRVSADRSASADLQAAQSGVSDPHRVSPLPA